LTTTGERSGLDVLQRDGGCASLGVGGRELLFLVEERGAPPAVGHTGLYHFAMLLPRRVDLARWLAQQRATGWSSSGSQITSSAKRCI
jgi:catechol-2,3-dioxygenase